MLPLLKQLYELGESKEEYPRLYVLLGILTVLSNDEVYNESIQQVVSCCVSLHGMGFQSNRNCLPRQTVPPQPWYTQAVVKTGLPLSGLTLLVLIRAIQANLSQHKVIARRCSSRMARWLTKSGQDTYIHTNCIAILCNIAGKTTGMHLIVAQKIVRYAPVLFSSFKGIRTRLTETSTFEVVSRRYLKLHSLGPSSASNLSDVTLPASGQVNIGHATVLSKNGVLQRLSLAVRVSRDRS